MSILKIILIFQFSSITPTYASQPKPTYTWNGKNISYKQFRDSLKSEYLKYCDSLKKRKL